MFFLKASNDAEFRQEFLLEIWHSGMKQECPAVGTGVFFLCTLHDFLHPQRYKVLGGMLAILFLFVVFWSHTCLSVLCLISYPTKFKIQGGILAILFSFGGKLSICSLPAFRPTCCGFVVIFVYFL